MASAYEQQIIALGEALPGGAYLLRIEVETDLRLAFGRFKGGKEIALPAGTYVYVGSAMSARGPSSLARRLLRHAGRSSGRPPHAIREALIETFRAADTGGGKSLHWNIDHLLDREEAEITGVIVVRSAQRLEGVIAELLADDPCTYIIEKGLGANDSPGSTHLLGVHCDAAWWAKLAVRLESLL